jgi:hypothetical protein
MSEERHVTPVDDNVEHAIAEDCVCDPSPTVSLLWEGNSARPDGPPR